MPKPIRARAQLRLLAVLAVCLFGLGLVAVPAGAVGGPKVVVVVGPVGRHNADYRKQAAAVVAEARRYTSNVVLLQSPRATWARVKAAAQGASIFVFFGHGNGYPSAYGRFHGDTKDGMGLDPPRGANTVRHVNYGEDRIRASIRLAPGAAVLLYRLCYASGNTEPGMSEGTTSQSRRRVDGYGAGFLDTGAGVVLAEGHPKSAANYVRQLFTTDRTMLQVFKAAPGFHRHVLGPYASVRTPGARYALDPDRGGADPAGFYRSVVGNLELTTRTVTQRPPVPTASPPGSGKPPASEDPSSSAQPSASGDPSVPPVEPTATPAASSHAPSATPTEPPNAATPTPSLGPAAPGPGDAATPSPPPHPAPTATPDQSRPPEPAP